MSEEVEVLVSIEEAQATFDEIVTAAVDLGVRRRRLQELVARGVEEAHWAVLGYQNKRAWQQAIADKAEVKLITVIGWESHRNQLGASHKTKRELLPTQSGNPTESEDATESKAPGPTWSEPVLGFEPTDLESLIVVEDAELRKMLTTFSTIAPNQIAGIFANATTKQLDPLKRLKRRYESLAREADRKIRELELDNPTLS